MGMSWGSIGAIAGAAIGTMIAPGVGTAVGASLGSSIGGAYDAKKQGDRAQSAANAEERRQRERMRLIDQRIGQVREAYSSPEVEQRIASQGDLAREAGVMAAEDQHGTFTTRTRQRLAAQGMADSSVAGAMRERGAAGLAQGRAQAQLEGQAHASGLRDRLQRQRLSLESQIRGGLEAAPGTADVLAQRDMMLDEARYAIPQSTAGDILAGAGSIYLLDQSARGQGRRGVSMLDRLPVNRSSGRDRLRLTEGV